MRTGWLDELVTMPRAALALISLTLSCSADRASPTASGAPASSSALVSSPSSAPKLPTDEHSPERLCARFEEIGRADHQAPSSDAEVTECVASMAEARKVSPEGYACLEKCASVKGSLLVGLCSMSCVSHNPSLDALNRSWRRDALKKMTMAPTRAVDGTVTPYEGRAIAFRIALPTGSEEDAHGSDAHAIFYKAGEGGGVSVDVSATNAFSLSTVLAMAEATKHTVVAKRESASGFTVEETSNNGLFVTVGRTSHGASLAAHCNLYSPEGAALQKDLMPLLVRICESLEVRGPAR